MEQFLRNDGTVVEIDDIIEIGKKYILEEPEAKYEISVGTDSQNSSRTKLVQVITFRRVGHGGIFFYTSEYVQLIDNLRLKIYEETSRSIEIAQFFFNKFIKTFNCDDYDITFYIHCDIGNSGVTQQFVREIKGWIQSCGYNCLIKPESYTASGIADKLSK